MPSSINTRHATGFLSLCDVGAAAGVCCCCCCRGRCCFFVWESVYSVEAGVSSCCSLATKPSVDSLPDVSFTHTHTHRLHRHHVTCIYHEHTRLLSSTSQSSLQTMYSVVQKSVARAHFCFYLWNALTKSDNCWHRKAAVYSKYSAAHFT